MPQCSLQEFCILGTSNSTNPIAMQTIFKNTVFTNVASTSDGGVYWEGLENEVSDNIKFTDWLGKEWRKGSKTPAAHPNSRYNNYNILILGQYLVRCFYTIIIGVILA